MMAVDDFSCAAVDFHADCRTRERGRLQATQQEPLLIPSPEPADA
ncbi:hypothetical protein [Luteimonas yindakuii]|nr:hypothetical protein [Luteimonas yindakuii]